MRSSPDMEPALARAEDVCALPLVRRLAALLDRDPGAWRTGDVLPRGWHVLLFNPPTRQADLRPDGAAQPGLASPDASLPRLMLGGRTVDFTGDIVIGARLRRLTRQGLPQPKQGRSGAFAVLRVEHSIVADDDTPVLVEATDYVLRPARTAADAKPPPSPPPGAAADAPFTRSLTPDPPMLFRYSAITDNPHRIHYDLPYAQQEEGYPGLLVNGSLPALFLLDLFRAAAGREPVRFASRNLAPMFCGERLTLAARPDGDGWRLWAANRTGITLEAHAS